MSKFLTELDPKLKKGSDWVWILQDFLIYESDLVGKITIKPGFETDLASVPRIPIVYALWGGRAHSEAVVHDYLFRLDAKPTVTFPEANKVFLEAMEVRGKSWYIRYPMYWGVCIGSYGCFHKRLVEDSI